MIGCDGNGPHSTRELRIYPLGGGASLFLCRACWDRENLHRRRMAAANPQAWPERDWSTATVHEAP